MVKIKKNTRKTILNTLSIVGPIALVVILGSQSGDIGYAWDAVRSVDWLWVLGAFLCWCGHAASEGLILHIFFCQQKVKVNVFTSLLVGLIGMFYSSVTPAATGGQPMQVFSLKKRGVPTGISSSALAVKFFNFQCALLIMTGVMWALNPGIVAQCIDKGRFIVILGFVLNGLSVVGVLLLAINRNIVSAIIVLALRLGSKLRIVKDLAKSTSKADAALYDFRASVDMLKHHPFHMLVLLLSSFLQVAALMSAVYFLYRAFGLDVYSYSEILTLQLLLFVAASFTPLPGSSGAQEGGFYLFFQQVFPAGVLLAALFMWRFFTYYLSILGGMAAVIIDNVQSMRMHKGKDSQEADP